MELHFYKEIFTQQYFTKDFLLGSITSLHTYYHLEWEHRVRELNICRYPLFMPKNKPEIGTPAPTAISSLVFETYC